ncbi:HPr kinase/phosphorylase [uncultured Methylobacterium sp.]|uniref:HPr kinase/phosphorylase n=1 Tax=uncultured Methylobacterium sp. TaxID=157278 RepID=UPI0035CBCB62
MSAEADLRARPDTMQASCHATCVALGEAGVLIRGAAGAGKSSLALALIERAAGRGRFAALVGDDRIRLASMNGRLVARPHPALAGRIEIRGHGIVAVEAVIACVVRLIVDLVEAAPRLPEVAIPEAHLLGLRLPHLVVDRALRDAGAAPMLVLAAAGVSSQPHTRLRVGDARAFP